MILCSQCNAVAGSNGGLSAIHFVKTFQIEAPISTTGTFSSCWGEHVEYVATSCEVKTTRGDRKAAWTSAGAPDHRERSTGMEESLGVLPRDAQQVPGVLVCPSNV